MDKLTVNNDIFFAQTIEFLKAGKQVTIPVHGYSMMPTIRNLRDSVILEGVEGGTPEGAPRRKVRTGDIVLFRFHERYLLHRIIQIRGDVAEIQGDGVAGGREHCHLDEIYAKATTILRNGTRHVNPYSTCSALKLSLWNMFSPVRRYLLAILRRSPYYKDPE